MENLHRQVSARGKERIMRGRFRSQSGGKQSAPVPYLAEGSSSSDPDFENVRRSWGPVWGKRRLNTSSRKSGPVADRGGPQSDRSSSRGFPSAPLTWRPCAAKG